MGKHIQEQNLKTVNGENLIETGGGDLIIPIPDMNEYYTSVEVDANFGKVKTVNNVAPDASGNVTVSGGGGGGHLLKVEDEYYPSYYVDQGVPIPINTGVRDFRMEGITNLSNSTIAFGYRTESTSNGNDALFGFRNKSKGGGTNTMFGMDNTMNGYRNVTFGNDNTVNGNSVVCFGERNRTGYFAEAVFGRWCINPDSPEDSVNINSPILRVGVGTSNSNRLDGFIVYNNGNIETPIKEAGLIMSSPNGTKYKLSVSDTGEPVFTAV